LKEGRHRAILEFVRQRPVHTQQELARALAELGFSVTQPTLSRDIHELGLVRTRDGYAPGNRGDLSERVLSMQVVQFLAVIRTPSGGANVVARAIDEAGLEGIAGTVAGDDTILVVLGDGAAADNLRRFLGAEP
jgi:transcriptional regulator of arginine metabolism